MPSQPPLCRQTTCRRGAAFILALLLAACGGGQDSAGFTSAQTVDRSAASGALTANNAPPSAPPSAATMEAQQEGARLNMAELEAIAETGVLPKAFDGPLLSGADASASTDASATKPLGHVRKSAASRVPVYRFFNTRTSAHFFTTSETERANLVATQPFMTYEGPAFYASSTPVPGLSPVHRFYNTATGVHFYTISESERAHIAATLPTLTYEGIGYYASTLPGTGYTPLYRFFYAARGFHFYTNSETEKNTIIATLPQYSYEGIAYYVLGSDWQTPAIPHTGISSSHCFKAGTATSGDCTSPSVLALNPQQDGHRTAVNPMSYSLLGYSALPIGGGPPINVIYPLTSCVKDNVTGLVWEGKEASGTRAGTNTYTNYGDGRIGDASAYVNSVNAMRLCGYSDWRMPTAEELQGIVNYGVTTRPAIDLSWFPNTTGDTSASGWYWTGSARSFVLGAWTVSTSGVVANTVVGVTSAVRLVRGASWAGPRYMITNVPYGGDSANNGVIDRKTGLIWRRCLEGQTWNGSNCTGAAGQYTHEVALALARDRSGWRMPNVKELGSLPDRSRNHPAIDPFAFPGATNYNVWSSSPDMYYAGFAWNVVFNEGQLGGADRSTWKFEVRLVRISP